MNTNPFRFFEDVQQAHKKASQSDMYQETFITKLREIIQPHTSAGFPDRLDMDHDIGYLCDTAENFKFADRQLIKLVADYLEKAINKDIQSLQDPENKETYMRLISS